MAIGIALLFNIKLPINFNSPYKALSIQDFWRRWHITLSRFLRDYIYIPLGGNRLGSFRTYANLMATFILGGLWHGAGWTFIFWGFLHGGALVVHRLWQKFDIKLNHFLAWFITFNFINISWVFFRAKEWDDALKVLKAMFFGEFVTSDIWLSNLYADKYLMVQLLLASLLVFFTKNSMELQSYFKRNNYTATFVVILLISSFLHLSGVHEFLYFNF
jgi:D-alanyl-lipoteichoic acid acyltransferase DltB (MBOAT superfamily)